MSCSRWRAPSTCFGSPGSRRCRRAEQRGRRRERPLTFLEAAAFQWVNPKGVLASIGAAALFLRPQTAVADTSLVLVVFTLATVLAVVIWAGFGTPVSGLLRDPRHARIFNIVMVLLLLLTSIVR